MAREIKLRGSSYWDKRKPINKKRKMKEAIKNIDSFSKRRPINKISKNKVKVKSSNVRPYSNSVRTSSSNRYLLDIIEKRYLFMIVVIVLLFLGIGIRLFQLQVMMNEDYSSDLVDATVKIVSGESAPRGRIYDRNYNLLVDNEAVKTIYYKKQDGVKTSDEIELSYVLANNLDIDYKKLSTNMLKTFWYKSNKEKGDAKITSKERKLYNERKLSSSDLEDLIYERITLEDLSIYDEVGKEAAYIYYLMNKGYSYSEKVIKNVNVSDSEYAYVSENIDYLNGVNTKLDWQRIYLYGDVFRSILGNVSSSTQGIPAELASYYLDNGYSLNDRVGISYLEYQYEEYLKGTKASYKIGDNNSYEVVSNGKRGNDIVLTIDINLQKYLEEVLIEEVLKTKSEANTKYYERSYAIISNPKTGEVLAMAGKQLKKNDDGSYSIIDYTPGIVTTSVTPGSIVKGASMLVGYKYGAIRIGESMMDSCIKIKATPEKCSWKSLGYINDINALAYSSNYYQYIIAIRLGNGNYQYDRSLSLDSEAFSKYRDMYASFGLGVKTGIDLPVESLGYSGKSTLPGHLLDFSIGQYDTYTPIQIMQYINTIANDGIRFKPYLLKEVYAVADDNNSKFGEKIYSQDAIELGRVDVSGEYIDRVQEGFRAVVSYGLGTTYMGNYRNIGAGKTGTSQSFIDTDGNGVVDTETITTSFVGYAPYDDPRFSIVVISPDVAEAGTDTTSSINKRVSSKLVNKYFELYG